MMDEALIDEVAQHGVIFNRQKYYLNGSGNGSVGQGKYETKDEAWQIIAMKLRTDVETCKKRWKYLRERYVSQRKQGDPPVYEHLSRPYLEKMKFLDQHIQPRKSYRNVPSFLTSPHSANSSNYGEYNIDSKSNGSMKSMGHFGNHHYNQQHEQQHAMNALSSAAAAIENSNGQVKIEADQVFRDFAAAVASQQLQHISQTQMQHQQAAAAAAMADSSQNYHDHFRENASGNVGQQNGTGIGGGGNGGVTTNGIGGGGGIPSSSSSMKSPLSSPLPIMNNTGHSSSTPLQAAAHSSSSQMSTSHIYNEQLNDDLDSSTGSNYHMKKPRVQLDPHTTNATQNHNNNLNNQNSNNNTNHTNALTTNAIGKNNTHFGDDTDDDSDDNSCNILQPQTLLNEHTDIPYNAAAASTSASVAAVATALRNNGNNNNNNNNSNNNNSINNNNQQNSMFPSNADFLFQLYQQLPQQSSSQHTQHLNKFQAPQPQVPQRSSEQLLGELVTTELLKMSKERRKIMQKRILEILFFED